MTTLLLKIAVTAILLDITEICAQSPTHCKYVDVQTLRDLYC